MKHRLGLRFNWILWIVVRGRTCSCTVLSLLLVKDYAVDTMIIIIIAIATLQLTIVVCAFFSNAPINDIPHSSTPGLDGDLAEYHVKNPSPGALPDVNIPIHGQESIGN